MSSDTINTYHPFLDYDSMHGVMAFLDLADLGRCSQVSKSWNKFSADPFLWKPMFTKEMIPLVEGEDRRDYMADFKVMFPITLSGKKLRCSLESSSGKCLPSTRICSTN